MLTTLPESFEMDVWIDGDGMPRRQEWSVEISGVGGGSFTYRYDFPEWGAPLDVVAPPAEVRPEPAPVVDEQEAPVLARAVRAELHRLRVVEAQALDRRHVDPDDVHAHRRMLRPESAV